MNCNVGHEVPDTSDVITNGVVSEAVTIDSATGAVSAILGAVETSDRSDPQPTNGMRPNTIAATAVDL